MKRIHQYILALSILTVCAAIAIMLISVWRAGLSI
jgi:hypothetical protein